MQNFHGMELCWGGDMTGAEMVSQMQNAYVPSLIRRSSVWTFKAGKSVCLLREPGGAVWVLQEYTKAVDPSLTPDNLDSLGKKYKTLGFDLSADKVAAYGRHVDPTGEVSSDDLRAGRHQATRIKACPRTRSDVVATVLGLPRKKRCPTTWQSADLAIDLTEPAGATRSICESKQLESSPHNWLPHPALLYLQLTGEAAKCWHWPTC